MNNNPSIEKLANYFLSKYHKNYNLNFDRDISQVMKSPCFTLKIYGNDDKVVKMYFVSTSDKLIAETSDPFHEKNIIYFKNTQTNPDYNFWIGYIILDENLECIDVQRFQLNQNSRWVKEIFL